MATGARAVKNRLYFDLPAVFSRPSWARFEEPSSDYLDCLLNAFCRVFLRPDGPTARSSERGHHSLEDSIAALPLVANPAGKTEDFLDWLGEWVALSHRVELSVKGKRALIANALPLYRIRGTSRYLEAMLTIYLDGCHATVDEPDLPVVQLGRTSTVGVDTYIGGAAAHFFRVTLRAAPARREEFAQLLSLASAVIDLSKPAHTWYELRIDAPAMQIGEHSTIGVDTMLVSRPPGRKE
jgi:phage tail-like protein